MCESREAARLQTPNLLPAVETAARNTRLRAPLKENLASQVATAQPTTPLNHDANLEESHLSHIHKKAGLLERLRPSELLLCVGRHVLRVMRL